MASSVEDINPEQEKHLVYSRLEPRLEGIISQFEEASQADWSAFKKRFAEYFPDLFLIYFYLYREHPKFTEHLEDLVDIIVGSWVKRSEGLKELDEVRENDPLWYQSNQMLGGVCYIDLYAGSIENFIEKIPYFKELGLTYLHIMPPYLVPQKESDGGYAVSSYRQTNPAIGTIDQLRQLTRELRAENISPVMDLVFNHTSNEHEWAQRALEGDPQYQSYYYLFPDRQMPDAYEATLREIFPDEHPGAFTYIPEIDRWVWTTFHTYQWDLNYTNPAVFNSMVSEMLFLGNHGVEVLRLDAVAFIWKRLGTSCENLPEAHLLIRAFNAAARIAAPALIFKSEAIVHPDEVNRYINLQECQLSYNPLQMALLWNSLATRKVRLLNQAMQQRNHISQGCSWVNYIRVHDDIGWTFSDDDAGWLGINAYDHRQFLNQFYTGRFPGSFARGLSFQENPLTGDARISGTTASLAGLEKALDVETEREVELAIERILLLYGITLTTNGIPLIYLGDEIGILNNYSYRSDPSKAQDSRWVHRSPLDRRRMESRRDEKTIQGRIYLHIMKLIALRKDNPAFSGADLSVIDTQNEHVLGYSRQGEGQQILVFANFSEQNQTLPGQLLRGYVHGGEITDLINGQIYPIGEINLSHYQFLVLQV